MTYITPKYFKVGNMILQFKMSTIHNITHLDIYRSSWTLPPCILKFNSILQKDVETLPMMKSVLYAKNSMLAQVSPMEGVYTISTVPTMLPPPIHVATDRITHGSFTMLSCMSWDVYVCFTLNMYAYCLKPISFNMLKNVINQIQLYLYWTFQT